MKNRFGAALLSLALAVGLWFYVINVVSPGSEENYYDIPVVLEGESALLERGLMLTGGNTKNVTLRLAGNRSDLRKINKSNITLVADLTRIYDSGEVNLSYEVKLPGDVAEGAVTTQSRSPDYITVTIEERVTKSVPVVVNYDGAVPEGYIADKENAVLDYTSITVKGPKSVVSQIETARIDLGLTDRTESVIEDFRYTLCDETGEPVDAEQVQVNTEQVRLELKIQNVKEVPLVLTVVDGGGATRTTSTITVEPQALQLAGSAKVLENITEINLGTVNLGEILNDTTYTVPLEIPEEVTNLTGVTEATVEVKFPNLMMKTLRVTNIQPVNVPEGLEAQIMTQAVDVVLRGPKAQVNDMTENDISLSVDFSGQTAGSYTIKANVVIAEQYKNVGHIGSYSVSVVAAEKKDGKT